jgi:hypothetical protein
VATETLTHVADGYTGHTYQDWTRNPVDGTWHSRINADDDLKALMTLAFQADHGSGVDDWIESNFIMSDPVAGDIGAVTSIIWNISYVGTLLTASWVSLQAEVRQASTGDLIATTSVINLAADATWHRGEAFPFGGLDVDLTAIEAKDLAVKWKGSSSNGVFGGAFVALDILEPTITYTPVYEDIINISSPISMEPALASAIANAPAISSSTSKTVSATSSTSKTVTVNSSITKSPSVDSKRN